MWALGIVALPAVGLQIARGHFDEAEAVLSEAVSGCRLLNDLRGVAWCVSVFGALEAARGQAETACRLWGAADGLLESVGGSLNPEVGWIRDQYVARTRSAIGRRPLCGDPRARAALVARPSIRAHRGLRERTHSSSATLT